MAVKNVVWRIGTMLSPKILLSSFGYETIVDDV